MKRTLTLAVMALIGSLPAHAVSYQTTQQLQSGLNRAIGTCVDEYTCITKAFVDGNNVVNYSYSLATSHPDMSHLSFADVKSYFQSLDTQTINSVCTHPQVKQILNAGYPMRYIYFADDGRFVHQLDIHPSDC